MSINTEKQKKKAYQESELCVTVELRGQVKVFSSGCETSQQGQ